MSQTVHPVLRMLKEDRRYRLEAYEFLFNALKFAQEDLGLGSDVPSEPLPGQEQEKEEPKKPQKHLTGQQLCEAIRIYALDQFGYMAKCVLGNWGIHSTSDIGEMVYNLIRVGEMRKTRQDRREDFDNVYDFDEAFRQNFKISVPKR
jgi:uncharacterized repeat protein (TIGR04138 family)